MGIFSCSFPWMLKLSTSSRCRFYYWDSDLLQNRCIDAQEWVLRYSDCGMLYELHDFRKKISDLWTTEGIDSLGILRSLFLGESTAIQSHEWLRLLGFVHLLTASGLHLLALFSFFETVFLISLDNLTPI